MVKKIAVIGSGISGLVCAHLLSRDHEVHVFEAGDYIGGHTATVDVEVESGKYAIDTGFIVFNDWTYPNFIKLMTQLKVPSQSSEMSFSVKSEVSGLEYNGTSINSLFAQRSNIFKPSFHRMIRDILRFGKEAPELLAKESPESSQLKLGEYLKREKYSEEFKRDYIVPMGAAIWSASVEQMEDFPVAFFIQFFKNHGMLNVNDRPVWRVIKNGSRSYIQPIIRPFAERIRLMSPVQSVRKGEQGFEIEIANEPALTVDQVIFACHSDQALKILSNSGLERSAESDLLSQFAYQPNEVVLHTDHTVLPKRKLAWAAWNYLIPKDPRSSVTLSYDMNILQGLSAPETFVVSLNMTDKIDPQQVLRKFVYDHPVYSNQCVSAQGRWAEVSGKNGLHFCGAYWGYGFHEDGVKSALKVCESFGVKL